MRMGYLIADLMPYTLFSNFVWFSALVVVKGWFKNRKAYVIYMPGFYYCILYTDLS